MSKRTANRSRRRSGVVLFCLLVCLVIVAGVAGALIRQSLLSRNEVKSQRLRLQAEFLCEAGARRAVQRISDTSYTGEEWQPSLFVDSNDVASVLIQVTRPDDSKEAVVHVQARLQPSSQAERSVQHSYQFTLPSSTSPNLEP